MRLRDGLFGILALAALAATGRAGDLYQPVSYHNLEAAEARIAELEAELARRDTMGGGGGSCCGTSCCGDSCGSCCGNGCCGYVKPANWFDSYCCDPTIAVFVAGDSWRDASEFTWPNNYGGRTGIDVTANVGDSDVRAHLGFAYALYDLHGRFTGDPNAVEEQVFLTAGLFHRASGCCDDVWTWAASYDYMHDSHYGFLAEDIDLHQVRGLLGYMVNPCNEFGVWANFGIRDDDFLTAGPGAEVEAQDTINLYWRRYYEFGGETMLYTGIATPNIATVAGQNQPEDFREWVIGLRGIAPLSCNVGLFGGVHYVIPSASAPAMDEESWNIGFGIMWVRGCALPVLPTADNGWFGKRIDN